MPAAEEELKALPVGTVIRPDIRDFLYFAVALRLADGDTDSWTLTGKSKTVSSAHLRLICPRWKVIAMIPDPDKWSEYT